ncbi:cell wall-binding repeat-containing protein [Pedococcus soli]
MTRRTTTITTVAATACALVASGALLGAPAYGAAPAAVHRAAPAVVTGAGTAAGADSAAAAATTRRLAGANRYETAVAVSRSAFPGTVDSVFVASGATFADALAAGAAGGSQQAPVLLVPQSGTLPPVVAAELDRLGPSRIYVVGGTGAVSGQMGVQLGTHAPVTRIAGVDRFDTAAKLVPFHVYTDGADGGTEGPGSAVLANGLSLADGVTAGALAAHRRNPVLASPLLLTTTGSLPGSTRSALKAGGFVDVVIVGGTGVVSPAVEKEVRTLLPKARVTRLAGADRYATAAAVSRASIPQAPAQDVFLTSGTTFADALSVAPVVSPRAVRYALLPTRKDCVPAVILAEVRRLQSPQRTAVGGTGVVSDDALALKPC